MLFLRPEEAFTYSDNAGQGRFYPKATVDLSSQKAEIHEVKKISVTQVSPGVATALRPLRFLCPPVTSVFTWGCETSGDIARGVINFDLC